MGTIPLLLNREYKQSDPMRALAHRFSMKPVIPGVFGLRPGAGSAYWSGHSGFGQYGDAVPDACAPEKIMSQRINICQPGYGASCALCCGSHNIIGGRGTLHAEFSRRSRDARDRMVRHNTTFMGETGTGAPLPIIKALPAKAHTDGILCPHVAFIDAGKQLIGCLIYNDREGRAATRGFFEYTCCNFSCAARETLVDDEILFAARLMRDWYYYGPLVNSIDLLKKLFREYHTPGNVPEATLEAVKRRLEASLYGRTSDDGNDV